uniref:Disease resistance protein; Aminoacyl-tRNA synthetase, class 1a, anticodon-binding n=1 Tax=Medicago truncatula TaxID=3880 RepID=A2Q527_MEDTR|nr:Disease resistance protein; Aminoacyl-tRNA synthetase, class 1a, anticodon-binding [Medicago truncatula]
MAVAAVGEAFLSAFIEVVLDRLASPEVVVLIRGKKVDVNLVQRLKNTLYAVEAVFNDAEQKQFKNPAINRWIDDLKGVVYVADDLLDNISTKAATQKNKQVSTANYLSRFFNFEERDMLCKLENIVAKLESILKFKDILGLQHIAIEHHSSWRTSSTSLDDPSNIFGRDADKKAILKLLLDDDDCCKTCVIPIVGMGGVGKTILAQSVYNHDSIKQKFDVQAWACASDHFDEFNVTKAILESVTGNACSINSNELLHRDLKEKLTGKKFLIVLDDVWTEDYDSWNSLLRPLQYGAKGNKILVTTRIEKVASMVQTFQG